MSFDALSLIRSESHGLADAAVGNLAAPVEHCPGWAVSDLVRHVYNVHAFWGQIVERRLADPEQVHRPEDVSDDILIDVYRSGVDRFVDVLRAADPEAPVWTWSDQHDVAFVVRHQVQEAAVHRWDAENARGSASALEPEPAADAIEEFLACSLGAADPEAPLLRQPLTLVATDVDAAWTLHPAGRRLDVRPGLVDGTRLSGTAFDLLLLLYRRRDVTDVGVVGDVRDAEPLRSYTATD
jgi:uncharacterized protein (TIGR03083 family)